MEFGVKRARAIFSSSHNGVQLYYYVHGTRSCTQDYTILSTSSNAVKSISTDVKAVINFWSNNLIELCSYWTDNNRRFSIQYFIYVLHFILSDFEVLGLDNPLWRVCIILLSALHIKNILTCISRLPKKDASKIAFKFT